MNGRQERKNKIETKIQTMIEGKSPVYTDYVEYCFAEGQQPTSVKLYVQTVLAFIHLIQNPCTKESVKEILPIHVSKYLNSIKTKENGEPTSTSYRATSYSALKNFFSFLKINKMIDENPMEHMKRPKVTDQISQEHLDLEHMKLVMDSAKTGVQKTKKAITFENQLRSRNVAIMAMLLELGIRCSALTCLDVDNLDLEHRMITYVDKGEKTFTKPLSENLVEKLNSYLEDRAKMKPKTEALFVSEKKERCSYWTILNIVKLYTKAATGTEMTVHKMRHSAITAVYELCDHDIKYTSEFAGHSNIAITNRYINTDYAEKAVEISDRLGVLI